ncbi:MAG: flagellar basal body-associated FliL family protein [Fidelibacterota bacterium]|nr:MAG: flagellar basal body-associated FliL family protein [Candidatus Neomarinimicrobiota bacterium]
MSEIEERGVPIEEPEELPPEEEEEEPRESRPLPPFVKLIILVMAVLVLAAGAYFMTQQVILPRISKSTVGERMTEVKQKLQKPKKKKKKKEKKGEVIRHQIAGITANTAGSLGRRFVTMDLMVLTTSEDSQKEMVEKEYEIRDALIVYFGGRTIQEISRREFLIAARDTVRSLINSVIDAEPVDTVFFTMFLVQ